MTEQGTEVRTLLDRVLTTFTSSGVEWALLRGQAELATGRDVDLLVSAAHLPTAQEIIFELGGTPQPQLKYPWHRMYLLHVPGAETWLKLDIVDQLIYSRELLIGSGLERGCLERRVSEPPLFLLSPTDAFWTILLHCVLDKREVREHRTDDLTARVDRLDRPSPGEQFFASVCPTGWSPDRAVDCVARRDWQALGQLGSEVLSLRLAQTSAPRARNAPGPVDLPEKLLNVVDRAVRKASRTAVYPKAWRALGLAAVPDVFDVVEEAAVDATVVELRRRPGRCDVVLVVEDHEMTRLLRVMRGRYRPLAGVWRRLGAGGLESIRLVPASELSATRPPDGEPRLSSMPLPGRSHCRLATPS